MLNEYATLLQYDMQLLLFYTTAHRQYFSEEKRSHSTHNITHDSSTYVDFTHTHLNKRSEIHRVYTVC
jgi:hypothetical protein